MSLVQAAREAFGETVVAGFGEGPGRRKRIARHARGDTAHGPSGGAPLPPFSPASSPKGRAAPLLSPRERHVVTLLARGLRTNRIAERLGISDATVELHLRNARRKLAASTSAQAVANALLSGEIAL